MKKILIVLAVLLLCSPACSTKTEEPAMQKQLVTAPVTTLPPVQVNAIAVVQNQNKEVEKYNAYLTDANESLKKIGMIVSGVEVGYNYMEFTRVVADMNYGYSKFIEKYALDQDIKEYPSYKAIEISGDMLKSAVAVWKSKINVPQYDASLISIRMEQTHDRLLQEILKAASQTYKFADRIASQKNINQERNAGNITACVYFNNANNAAKDALRELRKGTEWTPLELKEK